MDKKSKLLLWFMFFLLVSSVAASYWRTMIRRNFPITVQAGCNPEVESCFLVVCDPEIEECSGKPIEDNSYFKLVTKSASLIPECNPAGGNCPEIKCEAGEQKCEETLCDPNNLAEGEMCSSPEEYSALLLAEEEALLKEAEESVDCDPEENDCALEETEENLESE